MPATDDLPTLLNIDELAERLGTSARHVRRLVAGRRVPYVKVGHYVRFDPAEISAWLARYRVTAPPGPTRPSGSKVNPSV